MISGISSSSTTSLAELRQQMFNKIDSNGDGSIDKSEMTALIEQNSSTLVSSIFGSQDTNQDSLISQIEFDSGMAKLGQEMKGGKGAHGAQGTPPPPPEKVFDTADTNKDGVVTREELAAVIGGGKDGNIDNIFSQVDSDGDGVITRSEDNAFLAKMKTQGPSSTTASGTDAGSIQSVDFQSQLFTALVQVLTSSTSVSAFGSSTSLLA